MVRRAAEVGAALRGVGEAVREDLHRARCGYDRDIFRGCGLRLRLGSVAAQRGRVHGRHLRGSGHKYGFERGGSGGPPAWEAGSF